MNLVCPLLLADGAQEALSSGNEQTILAYVATALGSAVVIMALFIVKREAAHKAEIKKLGDDHAAALTKQASTHAEETKKLNEELHAERNDRRKQETHYLKEVLQTAQAMSRSLDENTRMGERLASLIEQGK